MKNWADNASFWSLSRSVRKVTSSRLSAGGHGCPGGTDLCPELVLVMSCSCLKLFIRPIDLRLTRSFKQKQYFIESQLALGSWCFSLLHLCSDYSRPSGEDL